MTDIQCKKCATVKPFAAFNREKRSSTGYHHWCRDCYNKYQRDRRAIIGPIAVDKEAKKRYDIEYRRRDDVRIRQINLMQQRYASPHGRAKNLWHTAKARSSVMGRDFTITVAHIQIIIMEGKCQKSGIPFDLSRHPTNSTNPFAPSLDRIDNNKGYTIDNIQIVCSMFNMGKNEANELDFIAMCVAVADRFRDDPAIIARLIELRNAGL